MGISAKANLLLRYASVKVGVLLQNRVLVPITNLSTIFNAPFFMLVTQTQASYYSFCILPQLRHVG